MLWFFGFLFLCTYFLEDFENDFSPFPLDFSSGFAITKGKNFFQIFLLIAEKSQLFISLLPLMKPIYSSLEYLDPERVYSFSEQLEHGIGIEVYLQIHGEKFVEYQKEILQEFVADFVDQVRDEPLSSKEVEEILEKQLQTLNSKLQAFADKLREVPKCDLRGYVQIIIDNEVKTWMIGKTTLMIFRDDKVYSVLENSFKAQANIDQFSDFIGGELERGDVFLYAGTRLSEVLDQHDFSEVEQVLSKENASAMLDYLDDLFASRVEKKEI